MTHDFTTQSGILVSRTTTELPFGEGIRTLVDRLDSERGALYSSGFEYPDRYSRWEMGFASPPLEFVGHGRLLTVRALNVRGEALLGLLAPALAGDGTTTEQRDPQTLILNIAESDGDFAEEERSLQPTLFSPLRRLIADFAGVEDTSLGLYGAFGYDLLFQFEPIVQRLARDAQDSNLHLFLPDQFFMVDRRKETAFRYDYEFSRGGLTTVGLARDIPAAAAPARADDPPPAVVTDHSDADYAVMVDRAREEIRVGNVFEVVLSRKFSAPYSGKPSDLFRKMQAVNPSPYEFLIQMGDEQLVGASPEMFVRVEGRRVESSPISGTVRRGNNPMEDADNIRALYNSEKDEVELTMCTDVDRNDKARICEPGSVRLLGRRMIERYAGLFHTVDHVEGTLRAGFTGIDAFLSHMWAVTLTGAPKKRAVQLVENMESSARRWYGGAIGGLLMNGSVNTGITIRTVHLKNGQAEYRAGATLVFDSDGAEEAAETKTKATSFFRVLAGDVPTAAGPTAVPTKTGPFAGLSVVMVDNEDSFVHTLADYIRQTGATVQTLRAGTPVERLLAGAPNLIVHSPGPGTPAEYGVPDLVRALAERGVPQFGVCLGLQGIVEAFGGGLHVMDVPRHGKRWDVTHDGGPLFAGLPNPCTVGAYHSLEAVNASFPSVLRKTAWTEDGVVMAVQHETLPIAAVQFHPESILSMREDAGHRLIGNALALLVGKRATG
ncbi:MAG: anthranilate synthase component I [Proteobacteria bacterium]|nr:anthranilate synthase component I [Pseudomonadota bacterium]MDA1057566.1 anthranilate synthase component I [Pseudomonadota bacterium]